MEGCHVDVGSFNVQFLASEHHNQTKMCSVDSFVNQYKSKTSIRICNAPKIKFSCARCPTLE